MPSDHSENYSLVWFLLQYAVHAETKPDSRGQSCAEITKPSPPAERTYKSYFSKVKDIQEWIYGNGSGLQPFWQGENFWIKYWNQKENCRNVFCSLSKQMIWEGGKPKCSSKWWRISRIWLPLQTVCVTLLNSRQRLKLSFQLKLVYFFALTCQKKGYSCNSSLAAPIQVFKWGKAPACLHGQINRGAGGC